jgi:hypothetical protein
VAGPALLVGGCANGGDGDDDRAAEPSETSELGGRDDVRSVPDEYDTIQSAVDAAEPGDLVLVGPGTYVEAVTVRTPDVVIRGLDRNEVVLDGEFELDNGIHVLDADGVAVENLTVRNYTNNGIFWTGVDGYRATYVTVHTNGSYGVYAFDSANGLFERSYASGHPDAGFYIGQCYPCSAVVDDVVAEFNRSGYSGTNAGGGLFVVNSVFRNNHNGIVPNTSSYEQYPPERETTIAGNLVQSNDLDEFLAVPEGDESILRGGNGILVLGGADNLIEHNRVVDHHVTGIGVVVALEPTFENGQITGEREWWPSGNTVRDNAVEDSGRADLAVLDRVGDGNCFSGNDHTSSAPAEIEALLPCGNAAAGGDPTAGALDRSDVATLPADVDRAAARDQPAPEPQETMPDAGSAPWAAAGTPPPVDLASIVTPTGP